MRGRFSASRPRCAAVLAGCGEAPSAEVRLERADEEAHAGGPRGGRGRAATQLRRSESPRRVAEAAGRLRRVRRRRRSEAPQHMTDPFESPVERGRPTPGRPLSSPSSSTEPRLVYLGRECRSRRPEIKGKEQPINFQVAKYDPKTSQLRLRVAPARGGRALDSAAEGGQVQRFWAPCCSMAASSTCKTASTATA